MKPQDPEADSYRVYENVQLPVFYGKYVWFLLGKMQPSQFTSAFVSMHLRAIRYVTVDQHRLAGAAAAYTPQKPRVQS